MGIAIQRRLALRRFRKKSDTLDAAFRRSRPFDPWGLRVSVSISGEGRLEAAIGINPMNRAFASLTRRFSSRLGSFAYFLFCRHVDRPARLILSVLVSFRSEAFAQFSAQCL